MTDPSRRLIENRIAELEMFQRWYDEHRNLTAEPWPTLEREHRVELLALIRIRDEARRIEAAEPDPVDDYKRALERAQWVETL